MGGSFRSHEINKIRASLCGRSRIEVACITLTLYADQRLYVTLQVGTKTGPCAKQVSALV